MEKDRGRFDGKRGGGLMNMLVAEIRISMKLWCDCGEYTEFDFCSSWTIGVIRGSLIQDEISPLILIIRYVLEIVILSC